MSKRTVCYLKMLCMVVLPVVGVFAVDVLLGLLGLSSQFEIQLQSSKSFSWSGSSCCFLFLSFLFLYSVVPVFDIAPLFFLLP